MACSLETIKKNSIKLAIDAFMEGNTNMEKVSDTEVFVTGNIELNKQGNFNKFIAQAINNLKAKVKAKFGDKFTEGWVKFVESDDNFNRSYKFTFPSNLEEAYKKKLGIPGKQGFLFQKQSTEGIIASEKTLRDLSAKIADRIGMPIKFESDRSKEYKGKIENGIAYVNLAYATLDTPIHEILGHPIIRAIKQGASVSGEYVETYTITENGKEEGLIRGYYDKNSYSVKNLRTGEVKLFDNFDDAKAFQNDAMFFGKNTQLYNNLLKELETGKGKEVLDRIKRDYVTKDYIDTNNKKNYEYTTATSQEEEVKLRMDKWESTGITDDGELGFRRLKSITAKEIGEKYTLEEQQEEAIVELLGLMTAEKLDNVKDGKLISLLKRLLKEMKQFVRSLLNQKEVEIDKLPDNMTVNDLADLLAYSNSKLILPGYEVEYTTPDNMKFKTYQEASNHISELAKSVEDVDLDNIKLGGNEQVPENLKWEFENQGKTYKELIQNKQWKISDDTGNTQIVANQEYNGEKGGLYWDGDNYYHLSNIDNKKTIIPFNEFIEYFSKIKQFGANKDKLFQDRVVELSEYDQEKINPFKEFISKNKEYEQSKEIIEEWKKVNNIQYNPEEIYSRGQEFSSVVGAYSSFDVNLIMQNLLAHIEDNEKAGGKFAISAYTKPVDRTIGHLEGGGGKIKFKIYPQSNDILWAANTDVYSGSVWDASEKVNKDKKSELLGVSYTKYPSLRNVNTVQPNLANIVDDLAHHHNELGIALTGNNFRLEYDEDIPYATKKIIDGINKILDQKYGKLVKPEITKKSQKGFKVTYENAYDDFGTVKENFETEKDAQQYIDARKEDLDFKYTIVQNKGIQPTQTNETLKESIENVKNKTLGIFGNSKYVHPELGSMDGYNNFESDEFKLDTDTFKLLYNVDKKTYNVVRKFSNYWQAVTKSNLGYYSNIKGIEVSKIIEEQKKLLNEKIEKYNKKDYISQALINTKIAALKEVAKKYPRSLIRSEVKRQTNNFGGYVQDQNLFPDDLPFQKVPEEPNIKPGVEELFDSNAELASIGTQEQYSQYLDTIFPDSKVKDIVYHGTNQDFQGEKFDITKKGKRQPTEGFHFTLNKEWALDNYAEKNLKNLFAVLLNIKNPVVTNRGAKAATIAKTTFPNNDGVITQYDDLSPEDRKKLEELVVFEPEQIYILGGKQDIEGFKKFVEQPIKTLSENQVNYEFKAISVISKNLDKVKQWEKQVQSPTVFWEKLQKDLSISKEQVELLKNSEGKNIEEKLLNFVAKYSQVIEINTTTAKSYSIYEDGTDQWTVRDADYDIGHFNTKKEAEDYLKSIKNSPSQHYSNLTVPGGTNYIENEIATPAITPSIKGHAQFATDQGIGWFRSDVLSKGKIEFQDPDPAFRSFGNIVQEEGTATKTRRILEVQSDYFQKLRKKFTFNNIIYRLDDRSEQGTSYYKNGVDITKQEYNKAFEDFIYEGGDNQFLALLHKGDNWVTFFVKSIIQDSAKKGYEKVLFPTGNTAYKIESGGNTIEDFIKNKEDKLKDLEKQKKDAIIPFEELEDWQKKVVKEEGGNFFRNNRSTEAIDIEIDQVKKEIEDVKKGASGLAATAKFYEEAVTNILNKTYGKENVKQVTDEYGNTWNEITIKEEHLKPVIFKSKESKVPVTSDEHLEEYVNDEQFPSEESKEIPKLQRPEVIEKVKSILDKLGIKVTEDQLNDDTYALADITNRLIKYSRGKLSEDNFTEEVFHFIVEVLEQKDPVLFNIFMDKIRTFEIYNQLLDPENGYITDKNYQTERGTPDYYKLKKEAIAKLLTNKILNSSEDSQDKESIFQRLWILVSNFIDKLFGGIDPNEQDEFEQFADKILHEDYINEEDARYLEGRNGEFASKGKNIFKDTKRKFGNIASKRTKFSSNEEQWNHFESQRSKFTKQIDPETEEEFYIYDGLQKRRVTTLVKQAISRLTQNFTQTEERKLLNEAKMEKGTEVHKEIENIVNRYIDKATGLMKETPDPRPTTTLVPDTSFMVGGVKTKSIYDILEDHIVKRLSTYPEGTRFSLELPVVNQEEGYAGTADFVAFLPNQEVDILDWKTTGISYVLNNQLIERTDISPFNQKYWRKQIEALKDALQSQGVKSFRLTRAIPMVTDIKEELINKKGKRTPDNVTFKITSVKIGDVDVSKIKDATLLPVSAVSEKTGNKELDRIISGLWNNYEKLEKTIYPEAEKYKKTIELNKLLKTIRDLQTKKSAESVKDAFDEQFRRINRLVNEKFDFLDEIQVNQRFLPEDQKKLINSYMQEVIEARGFLQIFDKFVPIVTELYPEKKDRTEEQNAILQQVKDTDANKKVILYRLEKKVEGVYTKLGKLYNIEDVTSVDNPSLVGNLKNFLSISERPENTIKFAAGIINVLQEEEEENKKEFFKKFFEIRNNFIEFAKKNGGDSKKNIQKLYSKLVKETPVLDKDNKPTGQVYRSLISKINDDSKNGYYATLSEKSTEALKWWEEREKELKFTGLSGEFLQMQLEKDYEAYIKSWIKENVNFDEYQKLFKEKEKEFKDSLSQLVVDEDPFVNEDKKAAISYSWYNNHDILKSPLAIDAGRNWMIRDSDLANMNKWKSSEFSDLEKPENKPLLDLYNTFGEINKIANDEGMLDDIFSSKRFLAKIKEGEAFFKGMTLSFRYLLNAFGNKIVSIFSTDTKDEHFHQKDPNTGYQLRSIPVLYKYSSAEDVLSDDLFYVLNKWAQHVYEYQAISKYEHIVLGTELIEELKVYEANVGSEGNINKDQPETKKLLSTFEDLKRFTDYYLYSKKYKEKKWYTKFGDALYTYTALKFLGVHLPAITSAFLGGRWSAKLLATTSFAREDYADAERLMTYGIIGNKVVTIDKVNAYLKLLHDINPNIHDINENKDESKSKLYSKKRWKKIALGGYSFVDNITQNTIAVTFFKNTTVVNGNIVNINKYVNSKYQDFYDKTITEQIELQKKIDSEIKDLKENKSLLQLVSYENDKLKIEGIDLNSIHGKSQLLQYKNYVRANIKDALGNASDKDISLARLNWHMKFILQFKNWMPRVLKSRFKGLSYDTERQEYTYGRINLGINTFFKLSVAQELKTAIVALTPFAIELTESKLLSGTSASIEKSISLQDVAREKYHAELLHAEKNGLEFDISEKEFTDMYLKNFKALMYEMNSIVSVLSIVALLSLASGGADDEDKWKWKILLRLLQGYKREITTTWAPTSLLFITQTLLPILGSLGDIYNLIGESIRKPGEAIITYTDVLPDAWVESSQDDLDKSHTLDKGIKTIPLLREAHLWMSIINPEINGEEYNDIFNIKQPQIKD